MTREQFGDFIKEQRKLACLSQQELADKAGVRLRAIMEIEKAKFNYGIDVLLAVLVALDYTLEPVTEQLIIEPNKPTKILFDFSKIKV